MRVATWCASRLADELAPLKPDLMVADNTHGVGANITAPIGLGLVGNRCPPNVTLECCTHCPRSKQKLNVGGADMKAAWDVKTTSPLME